MNNRFADLHIHSSFSDGNLSPHEIIREAEDIGLSGIAITDHDCLEAIIPALEASSDYSVEVIPAVELTAEINNTEVHILGYFIDYKKKSFIKKIRLLCQAREERMHKMVEKLNTLGIKINPEDVLESSGEGSVGRLHLARILLKKGYIKTISEAFQKYIGNRAPCYADRFKLLPREAIKMIKGVGGIAVLAHPYNMNNDALIVELVRDGLEGIEVYHPDHSGSVIAHYLEMAKRYCLLITGGSDCHGSDKGKRSLGSIKIPYELVEKLKERSNEARTYGANGMSEHKSVG